MSLRSGILPSLRFHRQEPITGPVGWNSVGWISWLELSRLELGRLEQWGDSWLEQ